MSVPRLYLSVNGCLCPKSEPDPEWGDVSEASILFENESGGDETYDVHWAPRLITALDSLLMEFGVELVWLTNWNERDAARQLLVPEFHGLVGGRTLDTAVAPLTPDGRHGLWKSERIEEDQNIPAPFMWIDDVAVNGHGEKVLEATKGTPSLLIPPSPSVGITVEDVADMRTWLKRLQPH